MSRNFYVGTRSCKGRHTVHAGFVKSGVRVRGKGMDLHRLLYIKGGRAPRSEGIIDTCICESTYSAAICTYM